MASYRTKALDYDARRAPQTAQYCIRCQKDLRPLQQRRMVRLIDGGMTILHPADETLYTPDSGDCGWHAIGSDCARKIGMQWSVKQA